MNDNTPVIENPVENTKSNGSDHPEYITIKYNHEEKQIPWEEAVALTQKGMNYDKKIEEYQQLQEKLQSYESTDTRGMVEFMSNFLQKNGFTNADGSPDFEAYKNAIETEKLVKQSVPKEYAKDLVETKKQADMTKKELEELKNKLNTNKEMDEFLKEFPDVGLEIQKRKIEGKPVDDIIPKEVVKMKNDLKISLTDAYLRYKYKNLAKKQTEETEIDKKNKENAEASTGSMSNSGTDNQFFTKEDVQGMTREQVLANYENIIKSQKKWK
jgi:hypothetical protein